MLNQNHIYNSRATTYIPWHISFPQCSGSGSYFLIGIHSILGGTATARDGVKRKRSTRTLKHTGNLFRRSRVKRCLLILDLKLFRSCQRKAFYRQKIPDQCVVVQGKTMLI